MKQVLAAIACLAVVVGTCPPVDAAPRPELSVQHPPRASPGGQVQVDIVASQPLEGIGSFSIVLGYDPETLNPRAVVSAFPTANSNLKEPGRVRFGAIALTGASVGKGEPIVRITFEVARDAHHGGTPLTLESVEVTGTVPPVPPERIMVRTANAVLKIR